MKKVIVLAIALLTSPTEAKVVSLYCSYQAPGSTKLSEIIKIDCDRSTVSSGGNLYSAAMTLTIIRQ
jgi:hypothetical protein